MLRARGVTQAWAGSFDGLLHEDIAGVNQRLAQECRHHGPDLLVPFGSVNPALPDWEEDLRRCHEEHRMPGIRLHPNYGGYAVTDREFERLLRMAAERGLLVQLAVRMQDERVHHWLTKVPPVNPTPLAALARSIPRLRLVMLGALQTIPAPWAQDLAGTGRVAFDIAMLEGVGAVAFAIESLGIQSLVFGTHAPLFYIESASLKLRESDLSAQQLRAIRHENAQRLLETKS